MPPTMGSFGTSRNTGPSTRETTTSWLGCDSTFSSGFAATVFVRADASDDTDALAMALARWLGGAKGLDDFLVAVLEKGTQEKIDRYLSNKGIPELPEEEWEAIGQSSHAVEFSLPFAEEVAPAEA